MSDTISFTKEQQWKTTYYALLLDSAIIALFQINTVIRWWWVYVLLKIIACLIAVAGGGV